MEAKELSKKMVDYRAEQNISQVELAKKCKLTQQTICNVENQKQRPSKITLQKILKVIGD